MTLHDDLIACQCQIPDLAEIYERHFPDNAGRRFVEVGSFDGYQWSNTYALTRLGWSGLLFEPAREFYQMAVTRYADNPLVKIEPCAIADQCGMVKLFAGGSMTTIQEDMIDVWARVPGLPAIHRDNPVECEAHTLDCALARHGITPDFDLPGKRRALFFLYRAVVEIHRHCHAASSPTARRAGLRAAFSMKPLPVPPVTFMNSTSTLALLIIT